jgi:prepilin-type N-terminal cleavage/methylation domain-containing protein
VLLNANTTNARSVNAHKGFSLLELVIVVAITFVVAAMAMPRMANAIAEYKLRSTSSQFANLLQRARAEAVRRNATVQVATQMQAGQQLVWIDTNANGALDRGEAQMIMPQRVTIQTAGFPSTAITAENTGQTNTLVNYPIMPVDGVVAARFNSRGLPCAIVGLQCRNTLAPSNQAQGFVYYIRSERTFGTPGWAAVLVTPAGRTKSLGYSSYKYQ